MGYKGILPREAVKELQKSEKWRSTFKDIKKCITEFCREVWKERNEIWVEERWRQWDWGTSRVDQTEMNWDWEVSNQQHEIERWYRQVHGWDEIQAESVPQSTLEEEEWLEEDGGKHKSKLQGLVR